MPSRVYAGCPFRVARPAPRYRGWISGETLKRRFSVVFVSLKYSNAYLTRLLTYGWAITFALGEWLTSGWG